MGDDAIQSLITEWRAVNDKAGELIIEKLGPYVFRLCLHFTRNPDNAEDLAQDSWIRVMRTLRQFRGSKSDVAASFRSWLYTVVKSVFLNDWLKRSRRGKRENSSAAMNSEIAWKRDPVTGELSPVVLEPSAAPDREHEKNEDSDHLRKTLDSLDEPCRTMLILKYFEEFDHQELAEALGISKSTVDHKSKYCLKALQKKLQSGSGGGV